MLCGDNYFSGVQQNVQHLLGHQKFDLKKHDVTFPLYVEEVDQIYHLACPASPVYYQLDPVQTVKTNVHGTINVLDVIQLMNLILDI